MDCTHDRAALAWACVGESAAAWGEVFPALKQSWQGAAHLPSMVVCQPAANQRGIAFAFAGVLKNNPLACQGYKGRENKLLSELIKLLSVAAHVALSVRLGQSLVR